MFLKLSLISALLVALVLPTASIASLPVHPGHPIVGISHAEAKRERAMTKTTLRHAFPR